VDTAVIDDVERQAIAPPAEHRFPVVGAITRSFLADLRIARLESRERTPL
jgi:hypothetical protein